MLLFTSYLWVWFKSQSQKDCRLKSLSRNTVRRLVVSSLPYRTDCHQLYNHGNIKAPKALSLFGGMTRMGHNLKSFKALEICFHKLQLNILLSYAKTEVTLDKDKDTIQGPVMVLAYLDDIVLLHQRGFELKRWLFWKTEETISVKMQKVRLVKNCEPLQTEKRRDNTTNCVKLIKLKSFEVLYIGKNQNG